MVFLETPCSAAPARIERSRSPGLSRPSSISLMVPASRRSTFTTVPLGWMGQLGSLSHQLSLVDALLYLYDARSREAPEAGPGGAGSARMLPDAWPAAPARARTTTGGDRSM